MFQITLGPSGEHCARRRVARFSRTVVALVAMVIGVGSVAVENAFAAPPPGLPALPSAAPPTTTPAAPPQSTSTPQSSTPSTPPPTNGSSPPPTATSASLRVSRRKNQAKLTFACQSSGTARLTVQFGSHAWRSATKRYTCRKSSGKVTIALSKSIARRLRHPGTKVSASLAVNNGSSSSTLDVSLKAAHAASASGPYWDGAESACDIQDIGNGLWGSIGVGVPQPDYYPDQFPGGWMWYTWHSTLYYWDGTQNNGWRVLEGAQDGYGDPQPWSHPSIGWLNQGLWLLNSDYGSQHYNLPPDHQYYTIVAVQTYYEDAYGQWYGGESHFDHNTAVTNGGQMSGPWCYFP